MPTTYTPIRYPGGKTKLYPQIMRIFEANNLRGCTYYEAFAGGAGLACKLLLKEEVNRIVINDIDRAVYCMWLMIVRNPDELCHFIDNAQLNVKEWQAHRETYLNQDSASDSELGKSAFYLNRTNMSGIIKGGLIGGQSQTGKYKMDARFNKTTLKLKIKALSSKSDSIQIENMDAATFIQTRIVDDNGFAYFDPPYVQKGPGLYRNSYTDSSHRALGEVIKSCVCPWLVTYDSNPLISDIYKPFEKTEISISYSARQSSKGNEILIFSPRLSNPL